MIATVRSLRPPPLDAVLIERVEAAVMEATTPEALSIYLGTFERLKAVAWARLCAVSTASAEPKAEPDRLLKAKEAAALLGCSIDHLYRCKGSLAFTIQTGRAVRFSLHGLQRHIADSRGVK
jgi:hypothetical protein